jgi:hypothetical protein
LVHACSLAVSTAAVAGAFRITRHLKQTGVGSEPASAMPHAKCHRHMLFIGSHAKATSLSSCWLGHDACQEPLCHPSSCCCQHAYVPSVRTIAAAAVVHRVGDRATCVTTTLPTFQHWPWQSTLHDAALTWARFLLYCLMCSVASSVCRCMTHWERTPLSSS